MDSLLSPYTQQELPLLLLPEGFLLIIFQQQKLLPSPAPAPPLSLEVESLEDLNHPKASLFQEAILCLTANRLILSYAQAFPTLEELLLLTPREIGPAQLTETTLPEERLESASSYMEVQLVLSLNLPQEQEETF